MSGSLLRSGTSSICSESAGGGLLSLSRYIELGDASLDVTFPFRHLYSSEMRRGALSRGGWSESGGLVSLPSSRTSWVEGCLSLGAYISSRGFSLVRSHIF